MSSTVRPAELADWMMARGQHFMTTERAAEVLGVRPQDVRHSLRRPLAARQLVSVSNGAWVPVPPEHRAAGAPPPAHFVDPLMSLLGHPYYVGFLTAAAIHGASHQAPMVFQVVTPARLRSRTIGRGRVDFVHRAAAAQRKTRRVTVPTGRITVSTPEVAVLDLIDEPRRGGGLSNVATVVAQFLEDRTLDPDALAAAAGDYPRAVCQRAGHLIERAGEMAGTSIDLDSLHAVAATVDWTDLDPHRDRDGERDLRWRVIVNTEIEPDL